MKEIKMFTMNGVTYSQTEKGYCYKTTGTFDKKGNELTMRIAKHVFELALEDYINGDWEKEAGFEERKEAQDKSDKAAEKAFNKNDKVKKEAKAKKTSKPRRSKDVAFEFGNVTLTSKQVDFIKHIPDTCFYEHGLNSTVWCDVLADEIGGQFAGKPMTVGAMISTLKEKGIVYVEIDHVNGKKAKYMGFTEFGRDIAKELGLE